MSKSPNSTNLFIPAAGGAALMLGVAYGVATTGYGNDRIEALQTSFDAERAAVEQQSARVSELEAALAELQSTSEAALAEAQAEAQQKVSSIEAQVASLRSQLASAQENQGNTGSPAPVEVAASTPAPASGAALGIGRPALEEEIAAWNVDILPDGRGLPEGSGDVWTGEEVFAEKCAACHGDFAEGRDAWPVLAGGFDTLADVDPVKTVGSYWPYLSTVWDYVHRSMPFGNAGTLTDDEVYAITAYILYSNDLVDDDFTLSRDTFLDVEMYNADGFVVDDRPAVEYTMWRGEPCMTDCKSEPAQITRRSTDVGVTPADDGSMAESFMEQQLATLGGTEWGKERLAGSVLMGPGGVAQEEPSEDASEDAVEVASADSGEGETAATEDAGPDPALVAKGEAVFKKCTSCHQVGDGAKNRSGPQLNGVVGRAIGGLDDFKYSKVFQGAHDEGQAWDDENLAAFLENPKGYFKGTRMSFRGLNDPADIDAVIAFLKANSQ